MDAVFQLDQLARAVSQMRDLQFKNLRLPFWAEDPEMYDAQRRVDALVARVIGGSCAPLPTHFAAQLFAVPIEEEPPPLLLPSAYAVNFPPSAEDIPELPPPPPPPLRFMSLDVNTKQHQQWKPSEDVL
jgi:hypothetical protein